MSGPPDMEDKKRKLELEEEMSRFEQELLSEQPPVKPPVLSAQTFRQASQHIEHTLSRQPASVPVPASVHSQMNHVVTAPNPFVPRQLTQHHPPVHTHRHPSMQIPQQLPPPPMPPMPPAPPSMMYPDPNMVCVPPMAPMSNMGMPMQGPIPGLASAAVPMVPVPMPVAPTVGVPTATAVPAVGQAITPAEQKEWDSAYVQPDTEGKEKKKKEKKFLRVAGGQVWEDSTLSEWEQDDFRVFVGDIGNEVTDEHLTRAFSKYPSFRKAKVVRDKKSNKTKGYGFVSFKDPNDFIKAMREMNGKYIGNRPIKLRKSTWKDRNIDVVKKKVKEKKRLGIR